MRKSIGLTAALEDYLEAILHLCRFGKAAHSRDIAEALAVHKSTVTAALKSLGGLKLVDYSPYEAVTLTQEGRRLAEDVARRHAALRDFFARVLGVDAELAESAACGMEHAIPREIVERLAGFADAVLRCRRRAGAAGGFCGALARPAAGKRGIRNDHGPKRRLRPALAPERGGGGAKPPR